MGSTQGLLTTDRVPHCGSWVKWLSRTGQQTLRRQKFVYLRKKRIFGQNAEWTNEKGQFLQKNKGRKWRNGGYYRKKIGHFSDIFDNFFGKIAVSHVNSCRNLKISPLPNLEICSNRPGLMELNISMYASIYHLKRLLVGDGWYPLNWYYDYRRC